MLKIHFLNFYRMITYLNKIKHIHEVKERVLTLFGFLTHTIVSLKMYQNYEFI
jgi:hypothetical protein